MLQRRASFLLRLPLVYVCFMKNLVARTGLGVIIVIQKLPSTVYFISLL
jgi:hypothetical protein